jgi:hypothetical protein
MVAPGFLANPEVRRWLNGIEPAWTMLDFDSFNALHEEPSSNNNAIRLEPKLTATEVSVSAVAVNAMLLLRRAAETGGLKLTATGNLSRAVVEGMLASNGLTTTRLSRSGTIRSLTSPTFCPSISYAKGEAVPKISWNPGTNPVG